MARVTKFKYEDEVISNSSFWGQREGRIVDFKMDRTVRGEITVDYQVEIRLEDGREVETLPISRQVVSVKHPIYKLIWLDEDELTLKPEEEEVPLADPANLPDINNLNI